MTRVNIPQNVNREVDFEITGYYYITGFDGINNRAFNGVSSINSDAHNVKEALINDSLVKNGGYGSILAPTNSYVTFTVSKKVNMWVTVQAYSDGGGNTTNKTHALHKKVNGEFVFFKELPIVPNNLSWFLLTELEPGEYKILSKRSYMAFNAFYMESAFESKTLILHEGELKKWNEGGFDMLDEPLFPPTTTGKIEGVVEILDDVSYSVSTSYLQSKVVNGSTTLETDRWVGKLITETAPNILTMKFDTPTRLGGYSISVAYVTQHCPKDWYVEASTDGIVWERVHEVKNYSGFTVGVGVKFKCDKASEFLYYRWVFTSISSNAYGYGVSIGEMIFYGATAERFRGWTVEDSVRYDGMEDLSVLDRKINKMNEYKSPLDDLEGDFEIVTWNETSEDLQVEITTDPKPSLLIPITDMNIASVEYIEKMTVKYKLVNKGQIKLAFSFDNGQTYYGYNNGNFNYTPLTIEGVLENGTPVQDVGIIPKEAWNSVRVGSNRMRIAYALYGETYMDEASLDQLDLTVELVGTWRAAIHGKDFDYEYSDTETLNVWLYSSGDFKINY